MRALALLALALLATAAGAVPPVAGATTAEGPPPPGVTTPTPTPPADPVDGGLLAVAPNPVADGDAGEYVVVRRPAGEGWTLSDGETTVALPATPGGVVAVTPDPDAIPDRVEYPVVAVPDALRLANAGETLRLGRGSRTVDRVTYEDAPEGEVLWLDGAAPEWRHPGETDRQVAHTGPATVEAFVLPDARDVPAEVFAGADRRVLLAGYTLTSRRVARALVAARERGATVRVLVEGAPVGGLSRREARLLDRLVASGVEVRVMGGPRARYDYHHAKYAVVDDRALVTTENFKPSGTGGRSNRGWGVVVREPTVADELASLFRADAGARDAIPWERFRTGRAFEPGGAANGSYPRRFRPRTVEASSVRVLVAPDNAERAVVDLIGDAEGEVLVQQVSVGGRRQPFLRATLAAARRGVRVRILLSSAWYVREDNRRLVAWLDERADREGLPLEARLAEPRSRYGQIHAKGVVVDGERAVVGSLNWNNHSARENREVALVLEGEAVSGYYARAFRADWRGGTNRLPAGVLVAVAVAVLLVGRAARRIRFEA